jgi:hypothetical protein
VKALLPFLFILVCPLLMLFMMRGMHGSHKHNSGEAEAQDRMSAAELRTLRDDLTARVDQIDARIDGIKGADATTAGDVVDISGGGALLAREDARKTEST